MAGSDSSSVATNRNVTPKRLRSSRSSVVSSYDTHLGLCFFFLTVGLIIDGRMQCNEMHQNVSQLLARQRVMCAACCVTAKINGTGWYHMSSSAPSQLGEVAFVVCLFRSV